MQFRYILSTLLLVWANVSFAQTSGAVFVNPSVAQPRIDEQPDNHARNLYEKATNYYLAKEYDKACETMQQAITVAPAYRNAYAALGEWYFKLRKYSEAIKVFKAASARCRNGQHDFAKPLAKSLVYHQEPGEALQIINAHTPVDDKSGEWKQLKDQAQFMITALGKPLIDPVMNMGVMINTSYPEIYPYITADTQTLYFTRRVKGMDEDFFYSKADSCGGWFTALNMGTPPNTSNHEYAQTFSGDGHYMFLTRCENRSENGWDKGGCDLYIQFRKDTSEQWSVPQGFGATINSPGYEGMACLSPDNRELYFVSDRKGGYGGKDIWVSRFEEGYWQPPRNLGSHINTRGDEITPYLHLDNKTLYFSSNGLPGMGGSDLFFAKRTNDSTWSAPKNIGFPINSTADDISITITENGKRAYFSSDRDKEEGDYDIYEVNVPGDAAPVPVNKIHGYVYDSFSKERLNYTAIFIYDARTSEELYHFNSNRGDGSFMITLPEGREYVYRVDRVGYIERNDQVQFSANGEIEYNISMLPDGYVEPISDSMLFTINFPLNSSTLSDSDKALVSDAIIPWITDPAIAISVNGYTDNRGNPMLNEQLSFERARLVASEITAMGIDPAQMEVKGWGEANPVGDNETEEGQGRNRRVEVILRR